MIAVVIPVCFLLLVVLWKKFPLIGGNINAALLLTGVLTLILGAVSDPADSEPERKRPEAASPLTKSAGRPP